jgi:hypothetical protein
MSYVSHGFGYNIFNPPDYWTTRVTDPTQPPVQIYPYGGGGASPYGPYPGFFVGQREMTYDDAQRHARTRHEAMLRRAETSDDPSHKYLNPEGRLAPHAAAALRAAKAEAKRKVRAKDPMAAIQKKVATTAILGAVLSALLR